MPKKNQCYIVKVYIDAADEREATQKVANAMLGRGFSWQILEAETLQTDDGLSPQARATKTNAFSNNKVFEQLKRLNKMEVKL